MSKAASIEPSGDFDGNDGKWSTFAVQIGTPPQVVKLLIATSGQETWAVTPDACEADDAECRNGRGYIYNMSSSTTWNENGFFLLTDESNIGDGGDGLYGFDRLQAGWNGGGGVAVNRSIVAGSSSGPYLGQLGISPRPTNFSDFNNPEPSFLTLLKDSDQISSLSYGYTAGASYRDQGIQASLTLGGYDQSRLSPNNVSFSFNPVTYRDMIVEVTGISSHRNTDDRSTKMLNDTVFLFLDAGTSHIWLPTEACQRFESVLGLQYSKDENIYRVDEATHTSLLAQNFTFTFELSSNHSQPLNISLPYAAFDLEVTSVYTHVNATTAELNKVGRYFPLRRAANESQYTLGRAFLQEAYMIVDYERGNFSIHQAQFNTQSQIRAIDPKTDDQKPPPNNNDTPKDDGKWKKIAIPVVVVVIVFLILFGIWFTWRRRSRKRMAQKPDSSEVEAIPQMEKHEVDGTQPYVEADAGLRSELEGSKAVAQLSDGNVAIVELDATPKIQELQARSKPQELPTGK